MLCKTQNILLGLEIKCSVCFWTCLLMGWHVDSPKESILCLELLKNLRFFFGLNLASTAPRKPWHILLMSILNTARSMSAFPCQPCQMSLGSDGVLLRFEPRFGEVMQAAGYENAASGDISFRRISKCHVYCTEQELSLTRLSFFTNNVICHAFRLNERTTERSGT